MRKNNDADLVAPGRLFISVAQTGSFSAAGRQLGLSPASVSRHINNLEDVLGVRLISRTSRSLSLTEAGQLYQQRMTRLLSDLEDTRNLVAQLHVNPRGTLRVHARLSIGTKIIAPSLPAFLEKYPDLRIDLWLSDGNVDLVENDVDISIRVGQQDDSSLISRKIARSPRLICATPAYFEKHGVPQKPKDLLNHNCLTYRLDDGESVWRFMSDDGFEEITVSGNFESNNAESLHMMTLAGTGVCLLAGWSLHDDLREGRLQTALTDYSATATNYDDGIYVLYKAPRNLPAKSRLFIDHLAEVFSKAEGNWTI